ncbi:MAG: acyltransferase [Lachnospiraceae bacterium]
MEKLTRNQKYSLTGWSLIALVSLLSLGGMIMLRGGGNLRLLGIAIVFCVIAIVIHYKKALEDDNYWKHTIGITNENQRSYEYDYLRVLATMMVIVTHAVQTDMKLGIVDGEMEYIMKMLYVFCLVCNPLYVMLSGALLFPYREEKISKFYSRRFLRVFLPMLVYFGFYILYNILAGEQQFSGALIVDALKRLYHGNVPETPHYGLLYIILSLYIVTPFFRVLLKNLSYKMLTIFVVIQSIFLVLGIIPDLNCAIINMLNAWLGIAVMGYWITRDETKKYYNICIGLGILALVSMGIIIFKTENFLEYVANCSPISAFIGIGIFAFVFKFSKVFSKGNVLLNLLSKYSYSIILLHWGVLHFVTKGIMGIRINTGGFLVGNLLTLIITIIISLVVSICIDNMVVVVILEGINKGSQIIKNMGKRNANIN